MSDPTTWATLTKTVTDLTTIIQQIQADLLTHNQDPSAHGQSGEGVYTHRIASILDHVDDSVTPAKVSTDISWITQHEKTADEAAGVYPVWEKLDDARAEFDASKLGTMLMTGHVWARSKGVGEDLYLRFGCEKAGHSYYYPTSGGWLFPAMKYLNADERAKQAFSWVTKCFEGTNYITMQVTTTGSATGNVIEGLTAQVRTTLLVQTVGAKITPA